MPSHCRTEWVLDLYLILGLSVLLVLPLADATTVEPWQGITREPELIEALETMRHGPAVASLRRIVSGSIRLSFRRLSELGKTYADYDALAWMANDGQVTVFINEKHRTAPPQALASLLAHEATHDDAVNSIQEEIAGWQLEASTWRYYCQQTPGLVTLGPTASPLVTRLNKLLAAQNRNGIEQLVRRNPGYQQLPETNTLARGY